MIQSMTGYASASVEIAQGTLGLELRSVNARFLDLQFRVSEDLRALEPALRERISARVGRGKLECRLQSTPRYAATAPRRIDPDALASLAALEAAVRRSFPDASPLGAADVLRWPGVLAEQVFDEAKTHDEALALLDRTLGEFIAARAREGAKLADAIRARTRDLRAEVSALAPLVPAAMNEHRERLVARLREALGSVEEERVRAEVLLTAMKADVDEELTRLATHLDEVERILERGGAAGKSLDFLMQELNREANTLGSKAVTPRIADSARAMKLLIEQMREQVQNIE
jgi:uncharacterized protein (TIGR00255 family)